jgi:hypothetical protein
MNSNKGFRIAPKGLPRVVASGVAAAFAVSAMSAVLWATPAVAATFSGSQQGAPATSAPAKVKYYIVPRPEKGPSESLYEIAAKTLGNGSRYNQIYNLNKGRLQPNGGRLENAHVVEPGWILRLPADAAGQGVRIGPLPVVTAVVTAKSIPRVPPAPLRPAAVRVTASAPSPAGEAPILGVVLIVVTISTVLVVVGRGRRGRTRRRVSHAKAPRARISGRAGSVAVARHAGVPGARTAGDPWIGKPDPDLPMAKPVVHADDYPSWPGRPGPGPADLHPDHPSWPGRPVPGALHPDHPSWPSGERIPPLREPGPAPYRGPVRQAAHSAPAVLRRASAGNWDPRTGPGSYVPNGTQPQPAQPWSGQPSSGQPAPRQSSPGQPWSGQPAPRQSSPGQRRSGQPSAAHPLSAPPMPSPPAAPPRASPHPYGDIAQRDSRPHCC